MIIRAATAADLDTIAEVHRQAFETGEFGHQGEADLVRAVHTDGDALVSLVAELDDAIIGHVLFSRMAVEADGAALSGAALAPVAVLPSYQGQGIGSVLIERGLDLLRNQGIQTSFVLGHANYYTRFSYSTETALPFASPYAGPHFMALFLDKSLALPESGRADYAAAFGA